MLGYDPSVGLDEGLAATRDWFVNAPRGMSGAARAPLLGVAGALVGRGVAGDR